jgi:hypothetical protein
MIDGLEPVFDGIDRANAEEPGLSRRKLVVGAAGAIGSMGLLGMVSPAKVLAASHNNPQTILNVAATAEVLATIVNTIGWKRHLGHDAVTQANLAAAAREELIHYEVLTSVGGKALTKTIWVPDAVFASRSGLLNTLQVGDQIFVNAYLIGTWAFGNAGNGKLAVTAAEFMGVEAVHRALARQSLGLLGNDRVFMKFSQKETAQGAPNDGQPGFTDILGAVKQLEQAGFGFGAKGAMPGQFYEFDDVKKHTPNPHGLNTKTPVA